MCPAASDDPRLELRHQAAHILRGASAPQPCKEIRLLARDVQQRRPHLGPAGLDLRAPVQDRIDALVRRVEAGADAAVGQRFAPRTRDEIGTLGRQAWIALAQHAGKHVETRKHRGGLGIAPLVEPVAIAAGREFRRRARQPEALERRQPIARAPA